MYYDVPEIFITAETFNQALYDTTHSFWLWVLIAVISIDIVTGTGKSLKFKNWDSSISKDGLFKHFGIILIAIAINILARMTDLSPAVGFGLAINVSFILTYIGSIFENADAIGWPVPDFAKVYFNRVRLEYDKKVTNKYVQQEVETTEPGVKKVVTVEKVEVNNSQESGE